MQNKLLNRLLESLEDGFDASERATILDELKSITPTDDALLGAKMLLEANNWDFTILKKAFAKTDVKINSIQVKQTNSISKYLKYAAVILPIGLMIGYCVLQLTTTKAIDKFYIKEDGLPHLMSAKTTDWDSLMELYKANEFNEAFIQSEELLVQMPENDTALYFHGVIAYELEEYSVAEEDFIIVSKQLKSVFKNDASYRLAFAKYHLGQIKVSKELFEQIQKDLSNPFSTYATKVLTHLN